MLQNGPKWVNTEGKNSVDIQPFLMILQKKKKKSSDKQHDNEISSYRTKKVQHPFKGILVDIQHVFNTINESLATFYMKCHAM